MWNWHFADDASAPSYYSTWIAHIWRVVRFGPDCLQLTTTIRLLVVNVFADNSALWFPLQLKVEHSIRGLVYEECQIVVFVDQMTLVFDYCDYWMSLVSLFLKLSNYSSRREGHRCLYCSILVSEKRKVLQSYWRYYADTCFGSILHLSQ